MPTPFGTLPGGQPAHLYTLENGLGMRACISDYGGTLTQLWVPDAEGRLGNVVLGFGSVEGYTSAAFRAAHPYIGALIGRYGNRIAHGRFSLDGKAFALPTNNNGHTLHGGPEGFDQRLWQAEPQDGPEGSQLVLRLQSPEGDQGFPGRLDVTVTYTLLANENTLRIDYQAKTDAPTVINLTHHAYFNLALGQADDVLGHRLQLQADRYTEVDATLIPTGRLLPVAGTAFDFRQPKAIGADLARVPGGYDHNLVLHAEPGTPAAVLSEAGTGRVLRIYTDKPGLQLYSGNFLDASLEGLGGIAYVRHAGLCLETQHFPDAPNHPAWPTTALRPGERYTTATTWAFGLMG